MASRPTKFRYPRLRVVAQYKGWGYLTHDKSYLTKKRVRGKTALDILLKCYVDGQKPDFKALIHKFGVVDASLRSHASIMNNPRAVRVIPLVDMPATRPKGLKFKHGGAHLPSRVGFAQHTAREAKWLENVLIAKLDFAHRTGERINVRRIHGDIQSELAEGETDFARWLRAGLETVARRNGNLNGDEEAFARKFSITDIRRNLNVLLKKKPRKWHLKKSQLPPSLRRFGV